MYSKDELLSKDISELEDIAKNIGVLFNTTDNQEDIVYTILDKQAEVEGNKNPLGTKRKRVRIAKKDTDKVYTVKVQMENISITKKASRQQVNLHLSSANSRKVLQKKVLTIQRKL